jgi:preprotein translocase subunit SecY
MMFRVVDLRNKILFTGFIVALFRLGCHIPLPFVDFSAIQRLQDEAKPGGAVAFLDLFSGGALTSVAVFALGIMPYITASIIMQLLAVVIPKLEEWQNEGQIGQKKITQWTRYLTVALALMQSTGIIFALHQGGGFLGTGQLQGVDLIPQFDTPRVMLMVSTLTAGTALIMWLSETITQRGVGNSRVAVPDRHRGAPSAGRRRVQHLGVPLRRNLDPHHRGCRPRDHETDRQPTHDAQLRGLPPHLIL